MSRPPIRMDHDELRRLVVDERLSFVEVGRRFGVADTTVGRRARRLGIRSSPPTTPIKHPELHDGDWLQDRFAAGRTIADVAAELGVANGTVSHARRRLGIAPTRAPKRAVDMVEVRRRLEAGESMAAIGRALGHHSSVISRAVRRGAAPVRS